jgi:hypothetical protein
MTAGRRIFDFEKVMKLKKPEPDTVFIETERLILRNFREGDAGDLFESSIPAHS